MATFAAASIIRFLATVPRATWSLALAACVVITPVSALAQSNDSPYEDTSKPCYRAIRKNDDRIVLAFSPECDLRRLAYAFPIREEGKSISTQRYLQSLYALNGRDRTDGLKPTVGRGCVRPGKPHPDATPGEIAACPNGLMNYYATPTDDSLATIIVPFARQLTYEEKLTKRVKELEDENAKLKGGATDKSAQGQPAEVKAAAEKAQAEADKKLSEANVALAAARAENERQSFWLTVFVLFAASSTALAVLFAVLWYWADRKRPVKYVDRIVETVKEVRVEGDWAEREKKLADSFERVIQDKLKAKDKELAIAMARVDSIATERDKAVDAARKAQRELAEKPVLDPAIARINEERGRAIEVLENKLKTSEAKVAELESRINSAKSEDPEIQKLAENLFAAQTSASQLQNELGVAVQVRDQAEAEAVKAKAEAERLSSANEFLVSEVQRLNEDVAEVTQERDRARNGNKDLRDQLETFRNDATKAKAEADGLRKQVEELKQDAAKATAENVDLRNQVAELSAPDAMARLRKELAERDQRIRDFEATLRSVPPPPAEHLSSVTPPAPPKVPEGAMVGGSAISSVTSDVVRKTTTPGMPAVSGISPVTSVDAERSSASGPEVSVAEGGTEVDETVVLETLRDHLVALGENRRKRDALQSQVTSLESIVQVATRAIEDASTEDAKKHGQDRLARAQERVAEVRAELAAADALLDALLKTSASRGYDEFRLKDSPEAADAPSEVALAQGLARAIEDCRDIIAPPTFRWPAPPLDQSLQRERDVLYDTVNDVSILLGEDPASLKGKPAEEIASRLKTRAVTIAATASHNSQSFTTAHERVQQLETTLAEEREACAKAKEEGRKFAKENEQLVMQKVALRDALLNANKLKRELQRRFDLAVEERRSVLDAQAPRTAEERLALAELRVAEAEREVAATQTQMGQVIAENSVFRDHFEDLERSYGPDAQASGSGPVLTKEVWDRYKQGIYNCMAALEICGTNGDEREAARAPNDAHKPAPVPKADFRNKVQQRLAIAEWGEVQSLFKTLVGEMSARQQRGDRVVFLVATDDDLHNLHDFVCMPLEYGRELDPKIVVRVAGGQFVHHASDSLCRRKSNDDSVSRVRPATRTLPPNYAASETPQELQDLLGNGGRQPT